MREPGGTTIGEAVRKVLLDADHDRMTVGTELLLYMACRAQLVHEVIAPALADGHLVAHEPTSGTFKLYLQADGSFHQEDGHQRLVPLRDSDGSVAGLRVEGG